MLPLVVSGPSGVGKTTLNQMLLKRQDLFQLVVSLTTRPPRPHEQEGVHYYFRTKDDFNKHLHQNDFVETQSLFGNHYGTLHSELEQIIKKGKVPLFEIDIHGALQIHQQMPAHFLFVLPGQREQLRERLVGRGTESSEQVERRVQKGEQEIEQALHLGLYQFLVNDDLNEAYLALEHYLRQKYGEG